MKCEPILVHGVDPATDDLRLVRLINLFGLTCKTVPLLTLDDELGRAADCDLCVLSSATTLYEWCQHHSNPTSALNQLRERATFIFVYGFTPHKTAVFLAARLSDGAISDVRSFTQPNLRYEVISRHPEITREFSGLSFNGVRNDIDCGFVCSPRSRRLVPLISISGMPLWALIQKDRCQTFLLACSSIADTQERITGNIDATAYFSRLLPAAMFLKAAFNTRCWHNTQRFGSFIIDDPPLRPSYGFLNYRDLLSIMDKSDFASTIAFIPWNYRRIEDSIARLFRERPERLSICVHGCDHTAREFATPELAVLNSKVQLASRRMDSFQQSTSVPYARVMVFPQGIFSPEALKTLKSNNYLAAVNSSGSADPGEDLSLEDLLDMAITRYAGCPLFLRRYPVGLEQFAFDLFFGKPALIVEHHAYLKDGGRRLADFIARLNSLGRLKWAGLHDIMTRSYLERDTSDGVTACRLFTNHQVITNHAGHERQFTLTKRAVGNIPIRNVLVNGEPTELAGAANLLEFTITVPAHSSKVVNIVYENELPCAEWQRTLVTRTGVWTRRMLSDFRDNILCHNDFLFAGAQTLKRMLAARANSPDCGARQQRRASPQSAS